MNYSALNEMWETTQDNTACEILDKGRVRPKAIGKALAGMRIDAGGQKSYPAIVPGVLVFDFRTNANPPRFTYVTHCVDVV